MKQILQKLNLLLDGRQKRQMAWIVVLMLVGGVLESLGVSLILPVMQIVVEPGAMEGKPWGGIWPTVRAVI